MAKYMINLVYILKLTATKETRITEMIYFLHMRQNDPNSVKASRMRNRAEMWVKTL